MKHPGKTPAFRGPHGGPISGSIAESRYLRLGGLGPDADSWRERTIGPPPDAARAKMVQGKWLGRFLGIVRGMPFWRFLRIVLSGPGASILDVPNIIHGMQFSQDTMWADVSALDLTTAAPTLQVPAFFLLGRYDRVITAETSAAYFQMLDAPSKRLVWFEESAHEPPFEEAPKFNRAMVELVRPVVVSPAYLDHAS